MATTEQAVQARPNRDRRYARVFEGLRNVDVSDMAFVRVLFRDCTFRKLRGAHIVNCTFERCTLDTDDPREILGVTTTLNCRTFEGLKFSPAAMDAVLHLVAMGCSDAEQREKILAVIDPHRLKLYGKIWHKLELP